METKQQSKEKEKYMELLVSRTELEINGVISKFYHRCITNVKSKHIKDFDNDFFEALDTIGKDLKNRFRLYNVGPEECEKCFAEGKYIEKTIGWYVDDEHHTAYYFVCPECGYDWTSYFSEGEGFIGRFDGWCDHNY